MARQAQIRFDIITIFSKAFGSYLNESILKRAQKRGFIKIKVWDLRKFARDKHHKVDDKPYGGGPGMVIKIEPMAEALRAILKSKIKNQKSKILAVLFSPAGKQFTQKTAKIFSQKYSRIIMICGHYEGIDERIKKFIKAYGLRLTAVSVGPYVLTGGELPAMVVLDAVSRHIPGVLGKHESLEEKRYGVGVPVYTRPEIFKKYPVPKILLSGDHKKVEAWRLKKAKQFPNNAHHQK